MPGKDSLEVQSIRNPLCILGLHVHVFPKSQILSGNYLTGWFLPCIFQRTFDLGV